MSIGLAIENTLFLLFGIIFVGVSLGFIIQLIASILVNILGVTITNFLFTKLTFIGVIHHELSHAFVAFITGAKVKKIELFTMFHKDRLGSVQFVPRGPFFIQSIQVVLTSIAPMIFGLMSLYYLSSIEIDSNIWLFLFIWYLRLSILIHTTMSGQDIKICFKGLPVVILLLIVFFTVSGIDLLASVGTFLCI